MNATTATITTTPNYVVAADGNPVYLYCRRMCSLWGPHLCTSRMLVNPSRKALIAVRMEEYGQGR